MRRVFQVKTRSINKGSSREGVGERGSEVDGKVRYSCVIFEVDAKTHG